MFFLEATRASAVEIFQESSIFQYRRVTIKRTGITCTLVQMRRVLAETSVRVPHRCAVRCNVALQQSRRAPIWVGALLATGCYSDPSGLVRDRTAPLQTNRLSYRVTREVEPGSELVTRLSTSISYEYRNPLVEPIYVVKCKSINFDLQKQGSDGAWTSVWGGPDPTRCLGPATTVNPGGALEGELSILAYEPNQTFGPVIDTEMSGRFRLLILGAIHLSNPADYPDGPPVETNNVRSNEFQLELRP